jgi:hypothetical protein
MIFSLFFSGTLSVNVEVSDVNDNAPQFNRELFNMTVMETAPVGTIFGVLSAKDADIGENGQLRYRFSPLASAEVTGLFLLNETTGESRLC